MKYIRPVKWRKRNFVSSNRNLTTIKRHAPVILKPLIISLIAVMFWKFVLIDNHISLGEQLENPLLFMVIPLVSFVYVIFASIAIESVFREYKTISRCVVKKDVETFLLHRDEQLPIMMHILIAAPSLILIVIAMLLHYENIAIGYVSVFSVVFTISLAWVISTELDDFEKSIWFREKIPQEWYQINIDTYFSEKKR